MTDAVTASIEVTLAPAETFTAFTAEIGAWYRIDRNTVFDVTRTAMIVLDPGVDGRLREVYDAASGEGRELARVTVWDPPSRIELVDLHDTVVEVTFEPVGDGTRVTLVHRGLAKLAPDHPARRHGWAIILGWFARHLTRPNVTERTS